MKYLNFIHSNKKNIYGKVKKNVLHVFFASCFLNKMFLCITAYQNDMIQNMKKSHWLCFFFSINYFAVPAKMSFTGANVTQTYADSCQVVTILVTLARASKLTSLKRFLTNFETEVMLKHEKAQLVMVIFQDVNNTNTNRSTADPDLVLLKHAQEKAMFFNKTYPSYSIRIIVKDGLFSRSLGLTEGLKACQDSDLVFIVDVDIHFTVDVLDRVRKFTSFGRAAYFPIIFSEFLNGNGGYWRASGFGIMAAYKADIVRAGGFDTSIEGWGKEDVDLYSKCLSIGLTITRTTNPQLVHIYHKASCW